MNGGRLKRRVTEIKHGPALGLTSKRKFFKKWKTWDDRHNDIPYTPDNAYKNLGWKGWGDFLGTGNTSGKRRGTKRATKSKRS